MRRRGGTVLVHLVNRASGLPNLPNSGGIDEIPLAGPVTVRMRLPRRPLAVRPALEEGRITWEWGSGWLTLALAEVRIHAALLIETEA